MRALVIPLVVGLGGCGLGLADDSSGGADDLPATGAGPWQKLAPDLDTPLDEPYLATDPIIEFTEPAVIAGADGGHVVFVTREPADLPAGDTAIWRGELPDLTAPPTLTQVLAADQPWEGAGIGAPAIVDTGDRLVMFYAGAGGIGRAESTDRGRSWTKSAGPILVDATSPGAAFDGTRWLLAFVDPTGAIGLATSADGLTFTPADAPILAPRADDPDAFDHALVGAPSLAWLVEGTGRGHFALWYAGAAEPPRGEDPPEWAVGYAASRDGTTWVRLAGNRPVASAPAGAPAVVFDGNRGLMLFSARNGRRDAVGIATTR